MWVNMSLFQNIVVGKELENAEFGDRRLKKRGEKLLDAMSKNPQASIPNLVDSPSETVASYRFLDNDKVTFDKISAAHREKTFERMSREKLVLALHDTTSLNYTGLRDSVEGLGAVGNSTTQNPKGLQLHTVYAITPEGTPLGTIHSQIWARIPAKKKKARQKSSKKVELNESNKWSIAVSNVANLANELDTTIVHVMDREADIFDLFCEAEMHGQKYIVRGKSNRRVDKKSRGSEDGLLISEKLAQSSPIGRVDIEVKTKEGINGKRDATLEIKVITVDILAPRGKSRKQHRNPDHTLHLTVILAKEIDAEDGVEPINWQLMTNVEISFPQEAMLCVEYYGRRWGIETFFRILKTGCRVERSRLGEVDNLKCFIGLQLIIAWHLDLLTRLARKNPLESPKVFFTDTELFVMSKLILKKNPHKKAKLGYYIRLLAMMGGFMGRKSDGDPGAEVLWRGLVRLKGTVADHLRLTEKTVPSIF